MTTIAQTAHIARASNVDANGLDDGIGIDETRWLVIRAHMALLARESARRDQQSRRYAPLPVEQWAEQERRYNETAYLSHLMCAYPLGGPRSYSRSWNWSNRLNGCRYEIPRTYVSGWTRLYGEIPGIPVPGKASPVMIMRNPQDHEPTAKPRDPKLSPFVHITFPDWVTS